MDSALVVRREGLLSQREVAGLLRDPSLFDLAQVRAAIPHAIAVGETIHLTHIKLEPGEGLSPLLPTAAAGGFVLDLDPPEWRSEWGGLLLFQEGPRVTGYRPVPGALTAFSTELAPLISLVQLRALPRISLLGWWP